MKKIVFILVCLFEISAHLLAQSEATALHPIDSALHKCLELKTSSFGSIECEIERYRKWSDELDRVYDELMDKVSDEERKALIEQQVAWAKYRDLQFKMNETFYAGRGSIWMPLIASAKGNLVKNRVLELQAYLNLLKSEKK